MSNIQKSGLIKAIQSLTADSHLNQKELCNAISYAFEIEAKKYYGIDTRAIVNLESEEVLLYDVAGLKDIPDLIKSSNLNNLDVENDDQDHHNANIYDKNVKYIRGADIDQYIEQCRMYKSIADEIIIKHGKLLPLINPNRSFISLIRKIIAHTASKMEKEYEYNTFKDKIGEIIVGVVRKIDVSRYGNIYGVILDLGGTETILEKRNMLRNDTFKIGAGVKVLIEDVIQNRYGPQILLSRTADNALAELMKLYINEISDEAVNIVSIARQPGIRSKVAVTSKDSYTDPVMTCVGHKGNKIKAISEELQGERIDVVLWDSDMKIFVKNALGIDEIDQISFVDEDQIKIIVDKANISLAIGSRGQNIRLASKLVGLKIDVVTEESVDENYVEEFNKIANMFTKELDLDEIIGQLLAAAGYTSIEDLNQATSIELSRIEGFDANIIQILKERTQDYLEKNNPAKEQKITPGEKDSQSTNT